MGISDCIESAFDRPGSHASGFIMLETVTLPIKSKWMNYNLFAAVSC
jgi:hypothetical protein